MITATRYHDLSFGHRVVGHESKCALLHGHNYRIHFTCRTPTLDPVGRVLDFSALKTILCDWVESNWDHRFLYWTEDPVMSWLDAALERKGKQMAYEKSLDWEKAPLSFVRVPFNPTAENLACYLLHVIGPQLLDQSGVTLVGVRVEETRKCSAASVLESVAGAALL